MSWFEKESWIAGYLAALESYGPKNFKGPEHLDSRKKLAEEAWKRTGYEEGSR